MKPTDAEVQVFWEGYGWKWWEEGQAYCYGKETLSRELPPIDPNSLFKYAVPLLIKKVGKHKAYLILSSALSNHILLGEDFEYGLFYVLDKARREK